MYYIYIIENIEKNGLYIEYTKDLKRRVRQHQYKNNVRLIYYESYQDEKLARSREKKLKYYGSAWRALKKRIIA